VIDIQMPNLVRIRAKLAPPLVREPATHLIADAARFAEREARAGAPDGAIARSISAQIRPLQARIRGSGAALAVEFGRHPGTPQPPLDALRAWARARGIPEEALFPIARAIRRRGIRGRFFVRRAVQKLRGSELPRLVRRMAGEISTAWKR
jgi:hypothetical protein